MTVWILALLYLQISPAWCLPNSGSSEATRPHYFDVQGHRGGRGNTVESTLPSFAWGLIDGATTLELDNGITKDGVVVAWHDENIVAEKCNDTAPAVPNDPDFPYVGKFLNTLTWAQLKTLDCGSKRQHDFPLQLTYPGTRISTMQEVFDFVKCADPDRRVLFNIESKINAVFPDRTAPPQDFVKKQYAVFSKSVYKGAITYQSFDWRSLVGMKELDPHIPTAALIAPDTAVGSSPWLAGRRLENFPGTLGEKIAQAAHSIGADILSASDIANPLATDPTDIGYTPFTTKDMIVKAHALGMKVKPWTVNRLNVAQALLDWGVDGIITDYTVNIRRFVQQQGFTVAPKHSKKRVLECLEKHTKKV